MKKSIDGLGYRVEKHRMVLLFEVELKAEGIPEGAGPVAGIAVCLEVPEGMFEAMIEGEDLLHEKTKITVDKIIADPGRGLGVDPQLIISLKPISYERFMEISGGQDPMKVEESKPETPDVGSQFGNN